MTLSKCFQWKILNQNTPVQSSMCLVRAWLEHRNGSKTTHEEEEMVSKNQTFLMTATGQVLQKVHV